MDRQQSFYLVFSYRCCGYEQHIRFVEHRNKNWKGGTEKDFRKFCREYAKSLSIEEGELAVMNGTRIEERDKKMGMDNIYAPQLQMDGGACAGRESKHVSFQRTFDRLSRTIDQLEVLVTEVRSGATPGCVTGKNPELTAPTPTMALADVLTHGADIVLNNAMRLEKLIGELHDLLF